ncbi:MAG: hypothetical protein K2X77_05320 [Candidatus Obscuribacterales bacterium]|nr:hypothetical protein [Candidatus Obscuribacterales bacterium]
MPERKSIYNIEDTDQRHSESICTSKGRTETLIGYRIYARIQPFHFFLLVLINGTPGVSLSCMLAGRRQRRCRPPTARLLAPPLEPLPPTNSQRLYAALSSTVRTQSGGAAGPHTPLGGTLQR